MRRSGRSGIAGGRGVMLLGALLAGCQMAPGQEEAAPPKDLAPVEAKADGEAQAREWSRKWPSPAPLGRRGPAVAYGGGKFFAVWNDVREGGVYGARVKPDGTLLDPEGIRLNLGDGPVGSGRPGIAFNGTHFFVVWETSDGIDGVRVKPDGTVVGPEFRVIQTDESFGPAAIACSPKLCLVTFTIAGDAETVIFFGRVTKHAEVIADSERTLSPAYNFAGDSAVAWNNSRKEFLVVWSDERGAGAGKEDIYGNRVKENGTILDDVGFPIAMAPGAQLTPDVAWSGRRYHVVWSDNRDGDTDIFGARVHGNGTVEDPDGIPISTAIGEQTVPRLAHHNSKSLVVWDDTRGGPHRVWGARLGEDGDVWDPTGFAISQGDQPQEYLPDVAQGADLFFTAYAGADSFLPFGPNFILGTRVNHHTTVKDIPALPLTQEE
ncbi:hypothetical protein [Myxococcus qinghaiensis]|uniref:hypothetical protein n=1 Tax=Myxococcus qinghaiensis TaxID=2906758 RepID=UPI0020A7FC6D|nr:hypothetical protein [Myxococcus qinghaiensis]MCP3168222.1 hypothetical protein [Myxococcus qinghaiensis]